jgi:hypothetical protein
VQITPDADVPPDAPLGNTFDVSYGAQCASDPAPLCAGGAGDCFESICRDWCRPDQHSGMQCDTGFIAVHFAEPNYPHLCVCVPQ